MQLILDPKGGMAGDMFAAVLISAGASKNKMLHALNTAANKIGKSTVSAKETHDGSTRLNINIQHNHGHLAASKARKLITELCIELSIEGIYKEFAIDVLEILIDAEKQAHSENTFLTDHHHSHHHEEHGHHHHQEEDAWLHEAQDIIIDVIGGAMGLQLLEAPTQAYIKSPVSLGGGKIKFSHGEMNAPAPATKIIIDKYKINNQMGPIDVELCTPTGSAILAALGCKPTEDTTIENYTMRGNSRGSKDLDIPPLTIYLIQ